MFLEAWIFSIYIRDVTALPGYTVHSLIDKRISRKRWRKGGGRSRRRRRRIDRSKARERFFLSQFATV